MVPRTNQANQVGARLVPGWCQAPFVALATARAEAARAGRNKFLHTADDDALSGRDQSFAMRARRAAAVAHAVNPRDLARARNQRVERRKHIAEVIDVAARDRNARTAREQRLDGRDGVGCKEVDLVDGDEVDPRVGPRVGELTVDLTDNLIKRRDRPRRHAHASVRDDLALAVARVARRLDDQHALARGLRERDPPLQFGGLAREHRTADHEKGRAHGRRIQGCAPVRRTAKARSLETRSLETNELDPRARLRAVAAHAAGHLEVVERLAHLRAAPARRARERKLTVARALVERERREDRRT